MPKHVIAMLTRAGLKKASRSSQPLRVLDLGCGQGALTIALAKKFACEVVAVDACPAFLQAAHDRADAAGVSHLCWFGCEDAASFVKRKDQREAFDIAIMLNLWPAHKAAKALLPLVKKGGFILIDDATWHGPPALPPKEESAPTLAALRKSLASLARIKELEQLSPAQTKRDYTAIASVLFENNKKLAKQHPSLHGPLAEFLTQHLMAQFAMQEELRPTLALLQRP
jgi:predicted O-methyltransferase YrrM